MSSNNSTVAKMEWMWPSCYMCQGFVVGLSNFIIVVTVLRYKALRTTKEYLLVMGLSLADGLHMTACMSAGIRRIVLMLNGTHRTPMNVWNCFLTVPNLLWSSTDILSGLILLVLSLDRLLAVSMPLSYMKWSKGYVFCLLTITYSYCFLSGTVVMSTQIYGNRAMIITSWCDQLISSVTSPLYMLYYAFAGSLFAAISIPIYGVVWIVYKRHTIKIAPSGSQQAQIESRRQRQLTISLGISSLCTLFLYLIPWLFLAFVFILQIEMPFDVIELSFFIINFNPLFNVFIYSMRHGEMKEAVRALFSWKQMPDQLETWKANKQAAKNLKRQATKTAKQNEQKDSKGLPKVQN